MAINTIYPIYSTRFGLSFLHDYRKEEHDSGLVLLAKQRNVHPYEYLAKWNCINEKPNLHVKDIDKLEMEIFSVKVESINPSKLLCVH